MGMKKNRKMAVIIIIAMVFEICIKSSELVASTYSQDMLLLPNESSQVSDAFLANEELANKAYNNLIESFRHDTMNDSVVVDIMEDDFQYSIDGLYAEDYPEYYAGSYINSYGNLVVMVKGELNANDSVSMTKAMEVEANTEILYNEEAKYNYRELIDTMTELYRYCSSAEYEEATYKIHGYGILDDENKIVVYINSEEDDDKEHICAQISYSDAVVFRYHETGIDATAACGTGIGVTAGDNTFSIGYRAKYTDSSGNVVNGFVTCGHSLINYSSAISIYSGSSKIGTSVPGKVKYSGKVDAAFIKLTGSVSNQVGDTSDYLTTTTAIKAANSTVHMYGMISGKITGTVESASFVDVDRGLTDQVSTTYWAVQGDSGGIVYAPSVSGSKMYVVGVQSGALGQEISVYSKVGNINNAFGTSVR